MGYQLKITIKNSHPTIWRRILVPDRITFFKVHPCMTNVTLRY
ncbi:MAG: hypothetical protein ACI4DZ_00790 [Oliverpabstia sp.]